MLSQIPLLSSTTPVSGKSTNADAAATDLPRLNSKSRDLSTRDTFASVFASNALRTSNGTSDAKAQPPLPDGDVPPDPQTAKNAEQNDVADSLAEQPKGAATKPDTALGADEPPKEHNNSVAQGKATPPTSPQDIADGIPAKPAAAGAQTSGEIDPWQVAAVQTGRPSTASTAAGTEVHPPESNARHGSEILTSSAQDQRTASAESDPLVLRPRFPNVPEPKQTQSESSRSDPAHAFQSKLIARFDHRPAETIKNVSLPAGITGVPPVASNAEAVAQTGSGEKGTGALSLPNTQPKLVADVHTAPATAVPAGKTIVEQPLQTNGSWAGTRVAADSQPTQTATTTPPDTPVQTAKTALSTASVGAETRVGAYLPTAGKQAGSDETRRVLHRSEPQLTVMTNQAFANTKQVVPLTPWAGIAATLPDPGMPKDLIAIDPITGEPRLSPFAATTATATPQHLNRAELPPHIARQLAEVVQQQPNRPVEITLKSQELGAVRLSVQQAESGIIVSLTAERPETLDLMRRHIDQLGQDFQAMGYTNIAFSFEGSDPGSSDDTDQSASANAPEQDTQSTVPAATIHLASDTGSGVDLRL